MNGLFIVVSVIVVVIVIEVLIRRTEYPALRQELRDAQRARRARRTGDVGELSDAEKGLLRDRLATWVDMHPEPFAPVMAFAQQDYLSPADIRDAVEAENEDGKLFIAMVASGLRFASLDEILNCFVPREVETDVR